MGLSSDLISQFAKITNDNTETKKDLMVYGTIVEYNGSKWVRLDGSDLLTPIETTTNTADGDRVTVEIKNHTATVTGNVTSPSATSKEVDDVANQISEFEIIIAYRITTEDLTTITATIENLKAQIAKIDNAEILYAEIEKLEAKYATLDSVTAKDVEALNAEIENLEATFGEFTDISTEKLEAINAEIENLKGYNANFTYVSADVLSALKAEIKRLDTDKANIKELDAKYANIDFSNIGKAAMEYLYAESGLIRDVIVGDGTITGELVGVTIKGDLIEGGTVVADKLVILGEDGLYYKLNSTVEGITSEQLSTEEYQSGLHGDTIIANTITAEKIRVDDLVAFDATIGGFHIGKDSIYSGVKKTVDNTTRGIYMDNLGQWNVGDSSNYIKYYKDAEGKYRLEISAKSISIKTSTSSDDEETDITVEDAIGNIQTQVDNLKDEITTLLRIESSRGTVFKNDNVATVLSVVIYHGTQRITDSATMKEVFGNSAYLEWYWQRMNDETYGVILSTDPRFGDNGFTFTLSPEDVDAKVTFMCELHT